MIKWVRRWLGVKDRDKFIVGLVASMDSQTRSQFNIFKRLVLAKAMRQCRMDSYPTMAGNSGDRVSGSCLCAKCGQDYYSHPLDWQQVGYGGYAFLTVLCNGRRVKL